MKRISRKEWDELDAAASLVRSILERVSSYYDDRSDKWQDSEAGNHYADWRDQIEIAAEAMEAIEQDPE